MPQLTKAQARKRLIEANEKITKVDYAYWTYGINGNLTDNDARKLYDAMKIIASVVKKLK